MRYLQIQLNWNKNKDCRVQELLVKVYILGEENNIGTFSLPADANFVIITGTDNTSYHLNITSIIDENNMSESAYTFDIPSLDKPIPISGFNWKVTKVMEVSEEDLINSMQHAEHMNELDELENLDDNEILAE